VIMPKKILRFVAMIFVTSAWPLLAQTSAPPSNTPPASTPPGRAGALLAAGWHQPIGNGTASRD